MLQAPAAEQARRGYVDTLREIVQQPAMWIETAGRVLASRRQLASLLARAGIARGRGTILLAGSGSSFHVGECLASGLRAAFGIPVQPVPSGDFLTHPARSLPPSGPVLMVSFARSGDSPESCVALDWTLAHESRVHHLIITCNADGALATAHRGDARILRIVLDERTNDRSLVMTSGFTSMVVAGRALAYLDRPRAFTNAIARLSSMARTIMARHSNGLARAAARRTMASVHLGTDAHLAAAREASLKMLEMSAGRICSFADSFLGLRHGPMTAIGKRTLVAAYLSGEALARAYELDLCREIRRKQPHAFIVLVGENIPPDLVSDETLAVDSAWRYDLCDDEALLLDVLVGQVLAFFACLALGLKPDAPSPSGAIRRVVGAFPLHDKG